MSCDLIIPAHNEQHRIGATLERYLQDITDPDFSIVVAMDDCTDRTADVVADFAARHPQVRSLRFPRLGKGGVIAEALRHCTADVVGFVDADCATPPSELMELVARVRGHGADIAIASRWHSASVLPVPRPLARQVASAGFRHAVRGLFSLAVADTQCGAKMMTRQAAERLVPLVSSRDFVFDVDLLVTANALGMRVEEVPTIWIDREGSRVRPVHDTVRMAASLARLWLHHRVIPVRMPSSPWIEMSPAVVAAPVVAVPVSVTITLPDCATVPDLVIDLVTLDVASSVTAQVAEHAA